jgi:pantetheine-phosphate adenylyltransferase
MRTALYPGSFDPLTNGHVDVVERAARLFDAVIVAVAINSSKAPLFAIEERLEHLSDALRHCPNVRVTTFDGLLVAFAQEMGATALIRGLRAVSDFEYEFQMALMNRRLSPDIETVFLMTDADKSFLSSSIVKEVARLGGEIHGLVPDVVEQALTERFRSK